MERGRVGDKGRGRGREGERERGRERERGGERGGERGREKERDGEGGGRGERGGGRGGSEGDRERKREVERSGAKIWYVDKEPCSKAGHASSWRQEKLLSLWTNLSLWVVHTSKQNLSKKTRSCMCAGLNVQANTRERCLQERFVQPYTRKNDNLSREIIGEKTCSWYT